MVTLYEGAVALGAIDVKVWGYSKAAVLAVAIAEDGRELSIRRVAQVTGLGVGTARWALDRLGECGVLKVDAGRVHVLPVAGWQYVPARSGDPWRTVATGIERARAAADALDYVGDTATVGLDADRLDAYDADVARGLIEWAETTSRFGLAAELDGRAGVTSAGITDDLLPSITRGLKNRAKPARRPTPRRVRAVLWKALSPEWAEARRERAADSGTSASGASPARGAIRAVTPETGSEHPSRPAPQPCGQPAPRDTGADEGASRARGGTPYLGVEEEEVEEVRARATPVVRAVCMKARAPLTDDLLDAIAAACAPLDAAGLAWVAEQVLAAKDDLGGPMLVRLVGQVASEGPPPRLPLAGLRDETDAPCPAGCNRGWLLPFDAEDRHAPAVPCSTCNGRGSVSQPRVTIGPGGEA